VSRHVNDLLSRCSQSLLALRTLRQHGLPADALQVVFQAIVINKLSYASPAWWGFASTEDQNRLSYVDQLNLAIGATARRRSPAFVTRPTNDSSNRSPTTQATFYIHSYQHGAIDITRFGNERMTLNFLIAHQNFKIKIC